MEQDCGHIVLRFGGIAMEKKTAFLIEVDHRTSQPFEFRVALGEIGDAVVWTGGNSMTTRRAGIPFLRLARLSGPTTLRAFDPTGDPSKKNFKRHRQRNGSIQNDLMIG